MNKEKKKKWLDEGLDLIIRDGFTGFNVDVLCDRMGIAKTSFYHYHKSRENYLHEIIVYWATKLTQIVLTDLKECKREHGAKFYTNHKQKHRAYYCFRIQAKMHAKNDILLQTVVENADKQLHETIQSVLFPMNDHQVPDHLTKTMIFTYLDGWDYLHIFDLYFGKSGVSEYLAELNVFLSAYLDNNSNQALAS